MILNCLSIIASCIYIWDSFQNDTLKDIILLYIFRPKLSLQQSWKSDNYVLPVVLSASFAPLLSLLPTNSSDVVVDSKYFPRFLSKLFAVVFNSETFPRFLSVFVSFVSPFSKQLKIFIDVHQNRLINECATKNLVKRTSCDLS